MHEKWIRVEEVPNRPYEETVELFREHINPGLVSLLEMGEYTTINPQSARGAVITSTTGEEILDFVSSYGALNLGHNHPRVIKAMQDVQNQQRVDLSKELLSPYTAFLAHNLSLLLPKELRQVYFCNSGTEAVEAALKLASRCFQGKRPVFIYAENALHGKTIGALSVTGSARLREYFPTMPAQSMVYGDSDALKRLLDANIRDKVQQVAAVILEPIQGEAGVIIPPDGYLREIRQLCDEYGVLLILDEIQTGIGRTGTFLACEQEGVVPDIVALAKSLGGGVATIGATIATTSVFNKAYENPHDCLVQTSTFGGRATACAAAMAALEVVQEENLLENTRLRGEQLLAGLRGLHEKYPEWITAVRGRGLMVGIEFNVEVLDQAKYLPLKIPGLKSVLKEHLPGMVAAALLKQFNILGTLMLNNRAVLRVYPPLIITGEQIAYFLGSLDTLLEQGVKSLVKQRVNHAVGKSGLKFIGSWAGSFLRK
jgi:putrescine aminotransferase